MKTTTENPTRGGSPSESACCSALRVPRKRPEQWQPGDIAIKYITLRRDDDPYPPCVLVMVASVEGDRCRVEHLDMNSSETIEARHLDGVQESLDRWARLADEMTVKEERIGRHKLEALAEPFEPFREWLRTLEWWDTHPEARPDGYEIMRRIIPRNAKVHTSESQTTNN